MSVILVTRLGSNPIVANTLLDVFNDISMLCR